MRALRCTVEWIVLATRSLAGILLICSVALNFANIIGRYFFHSSLSWGEEGMLFFMVGCVFMGSGAVTWSGRHLSMDFIVRLLPEPVRLVLALICELLFLITALLLVWFAWPTINQLMQFDQRSLAADIPLAIPRSAIPVGLLIMAFVVLARLIFGKWREPSGDPETGI
jgi:TRAP-type C4-dicarboxylate transport system permease small subunit